MTKINNFITASPSLENVSAETTSACKLKNLLLMQCASEQDSNLNVAETAKEFIETNSWDNFCSYNLVSQITTSNS